MTARTVSARTKGMSPGSTSSASPLAVATPIWIDENIPRDGSGFSTGRTRASFIAFTSRSSSARPSVPTTTITSAAPPSSRLRIERSRSGSPSTCASSLRPPKRSAEPAAVTTAMARNGLGTERPQRALREHARGALALRDRAGGVDHRTRGLVDRLVDRVVAELGADERARVDRDGPRAQAGDRDACVGDDLAVHPHRGSDTGDGEVERVAVAQLEIRAAPAVGRREAYLGDDLARFERQVADAVLAVNLRQIHRALAGRSAHRDRRAERDE